jgi:hypothetical protein
MLTSIPVHIEPADISHGRLECATQVARRFNARLIGVAAGQARPPVVDSYGGVDMAVDMEADEERIRTELRNSEATFRNSPAIKGLQTEWRSVVGPPAEVLARESRTADIIVLGRDPGPLGIFRSADPGDVLGLRTLPRFLTVMASTRKPSHAYTLIDRLVTRSF